MTRTQLGRAITRPRKRSLVVAAAFAAVVTLASGSAAYAAAEDATWTANPGAADTSGWQEVAWSPELGIFVAVANNAGTAGAMTSTDGITWTGQTAPAGRWAAVTWSADLGLFAAVGNQAGSGNLVMTSPDGVTWTARSVPPAPVVTALTEVIWSPERAQFVASAVNRQALTSPDGITWTYSTAGTRPEAAREIAWSADLGLYVAVGQTGSGDTHNPRVFTSADGAAWTEIVVPHTGTWTGVAYGSTAGLFVSVGEQGVATSPDGSTWTMQTSAVTDLRAVTWSPENGEFVAVGPGGMVSSPDGVVWTAITAPAANSWLSIVWSPELSRYVGVGNTGTTRTMVGIVPQVPTEPTDPTDPTDPPVVDDRGDAGTGSGVPPVDDELAETGAESAQLMASVFALFAAGVALTLGARVIVRRRSPRER